MARLSADVGTSRFAFSHRRLVWRDDFGPGGERNNNKLREWTTDRIVRENKSSTLLRNEAGNNAKHSTRVAPIFFFDLRDEGQRENDSINFFRFWNKNFKHTPRTRWIFFLFIDDLYNPPVGTRWRKAKELEKKKEMDESNAYEEKKKKIKKRDPLLGSLK